MCGSAICATVYDALVEAGLATGNAGLITDMITCPGLDFCALANARSIPHRAGDFAQVRGAGAAARNRRAEDQDFGLHQCLRPPPCRPHRHSGRREEGHRTLPDHGRRRRHRERRDRRHSRARLRGRRRAGRDRAAGRCLYRAARAARTRPFIAAYRRIGEAPFKEALYGSASKSRLRAAQAGSAALAGDHGAQRAVRRDGRRGGAAPCGHANCCRTTSRSFRRSARIRRCCCTWWRRSTRRCRSISSRRASIFPRR